MNEMNDEEKLMLFERKLLNISRNCSLVELSRRKIGKNLDFFQEHEQYGRKLKSLPVCLRDHMLRQLTSVKFDGAIGESKPNFERKLRDFSFLLSSETKHIELDGLLSFCPEEILHEQLTRIIQMIAAEAPNVQSLIINGRNSTTKIYNYHYHALNQVELEAICSLSKLKKLELPVFVGVVFSDLMQICETLQFLEHVDVRIHDAYVDLSNIDQFKRSFSRLRVFHFSLSRFFYRSQRLMHLCIEHLPKLRLMNLLDFNDFDIPEVIDVHNLPSETSSLMNLAVCPPTLPIHQLFPELRHLSICWPRISHINERRIDTLLNFSKLESLHVDLSFPSEIFFNQLLDRYGLNLRKLVISIIQFKLRMGDIMKCCKKLERLAFHHAFFSDQPLMSTQTFAELKELTWNIPICENNNYGQNLLHLLSSPKLEKVSLTLDKASGTDPAILKEISNLIANGQILRELKSLIIYFFYQSIRPGETGFVRLLEAVNSLVTNACAFLPKFTWIVLKPYEKNYKTPYDDSQVNEFNIPINSQREFCHDFRKFGKPDLAKFLFACRAGRPL